MEFVNRSLTTWFIYGSVLTLACAVSALAILALMRKRTLWTAAVAAISGAVSTIIAFYLFAFDPLISLSAGKMVMASFLFWCGIHIAILFGMVALKDLSRENQYQDPKGGHWFAWSGIISGILLPFFLVNAAAFNIGATFPHAALRELDQKFLNWKPEVKDTAAQSGASAGMTGSKEAREEDGFKVFPDLNFRFKIPPSPWKEFNFRAVDPNSVLGYVRLNEQLNLMITVLKAAMDERAMKAVPDVTVQALQLQFPDMKLISKKDWNAGGAKGTVLHLEGTTMGMPIRYTWWIGFHGGFQYSIVSWNPQTHPEGDLKEAFDLVSGFEILDRTKANASTAAKKFTEDYESPLYGYKMHVKDSRWTPWLTLREQIQWAEFGMEQPEIVFLVLPAAFSGQEVTLDMFANAVLHALDIDFRSISAQSIKKFSENGYEGYAFDHERTMNGEKQYHKIRVLWREDRGFLLATAQNLNQSQKQPKLHEEAHQLFEPLKNPKPLDKESLSPIDRERSALVLNRVATGFYQQGNVERAVAYLKKAAELMPENITIFENLIEAMTQAGRFEEAHRLLSEKSGDVDKKANLGLYAARASYEIGRKEDALRKYEQIVKVEPQNVQAAASYANLLLELERGEEAEKVLADALKKNPDSMDLRMARIDLLAKAGKKDQAVEEARRLHADYPSHDLARRVLFNLLNETQNYDSLVVLSDQEIKSGRSDYDVYFYQGLGQFQQNHYRDAQVSFQNAVRLNPADQVARQHLEELEKLLGYGNLDEVKNYLDPVKLPEGVRLEPGKAVNPFKEKTSYKIDETTAIHYQADQPLRSTHYITIQVTQAEDLGRFTEFEINYDSMHDQVYVNRLEVKDDKGVVIGNMDQSKFYIVDDSDAGYASHDKILHVPVSGVTVGSTIEFVYSRYRKYPVSQMPYEELFFGSTLPVLREQVIVTGQLEGITAVSRNGLELKEGPGYRLWRQDNIPGVKSEADVPDYDRFMPVLKLGPKEANWTKVGDEYLDMIQQVLGEDESVKQRAAKLVEGAVTAEEKVEKIFRYVQQEYSYNAIEFGLRAMIPTAASKVLAQKYGDCKDHAVLLYHLLQSAGLKAHLALVRMDGAEEPSLASVEQFDHMVVYTPSYSRSPVLDATNKSLEPWIVPAYLRNKKIFVVEPGASRLVEIAPAPEMTSHTISDRTLTLEGNDLLVTETLTMTGYSAAGMREFFRLIPQTAQLQRFQEAILANPRYSLLSLSTENVLDHERPLKVHLEYRISNVIFFIRDDMAGKLPVVWEEFYFGMSHHPERRYPFEISYPQELESRLRFRHPANLTLEGKNLPRTLNIMSPHLNLGGSLEMLPDGFKMETRLQEKEGIFPAAGYAEMQAKTKAMLDSLQLDLVLVPIKK